MVNVIWTACNVLSSQAIELSSVIWEFNCQGYVRVNRVLIIGATGNVGREVVSQLARTDVLVRALTRNPEAARFPEQVEVVAGDLAVPDSLHAGLEGVDTAFLVWTAPSDAVAPAT